MEHIVIKIEDIDKYLAQEDAKELKALMQRLLVSQKCNSKPPLGIIPKKIWDYNRMENLKEAIYRYCEVGKEVPFDWIDEYNSLARVCKKS